MTNAEPCPECASVRKECRNDVALVLLGKRGPCRNKWHEEYMRTETGDFEVSAWPVNDRLYYPLSLSYSSGVKDTDHKWELHFRSKPDYGVEATGQTPTRDEMLEVISSLPGFSASLVDIFIAAHVAVSAAKGE